MATPTGVAIGIERPDLATGTYPERIERVNLYIIELDDRLRHANDTAASLKERIVLDVAGDESLSNETKRKAALQQALGEDRVYQRAIDRVLILKRERAVAEASLERMRGEFKEHNLSRLETLASRFGEGDVMSSI